MRKIRILVNTEASYLPTGYGVYGRELLSRLHATGKYEIAELASFADPDDSRNRQVPWKFYPVKPNKNDPKAVEQFNSNQSNAFGQWMFEAACLDFKADVLISWRDAWMSKFEFTSPFRRFYKHITMPTVDAEPQKDAWLDLYQTADGVFAYSDWGCDQLKKQASDKINVLGSASPAAEYDLFFPPPSKSEYKRSMNISPDIFIVGTVMRNQKRKLYPDLLVAFDKFLKAAPPELAQKTFLYIHTCWPDIGWDIPTLIKELNLQSKVITTYMCLKCGLVFPSQFQYAVTDCPRCKDMTARMPMSHQGVSRESLAAIMKLFDVYVQYASLEGFGMPMVEAAACGLPVFATDYSAMCDVVRKVGGYPIKVKHLYREVETHRFHGIPDEDDFINKLTSLLLKPQEIRNVQSRQIATLTRKNYDWDATASKWMKAIDSFNYPDHKQTWLSPPRFHNPNLNVPQGLSNTDFVQWCIMNVAGQPELLNTYYESSITRDLNWGARVSNVNGAGFDDMTLLGMMPRMEEFNREKVVRLCLDICNDRNNWEKRRCGH